MRLLHCYEIVIEGKHAGGAGPMTIATLIANTVEAAEKCIEEEK